MNTVVDILKLKNVEKIGSAADPNIKYASDIDLQENYKTDDFFPTILRKFQEKFVKVERNKDIFITDFKCGMFRGQPVRWNKHTIKAGYQTIDGIRIEFIDCLQEKSLIKMDIIALINGVFTEFSNNYYFIFSTGFSTMPIKGNKITDIFLMEFQRYLKAKRYFKALKRLYSYFKAKKNKQYQSKLLEFFNSSVGKLNYQINGLGIIADVIDNPFRHSKKSSVNYNLLIIKKNLSPEYQSQIDGILKRSTLQLMKIEIQQVIQQLTEVVNEKTITFMEKEIKYQDII